MSVDYESKLAEGRKTAERILRIAKREYRKQGMSFTWTWNAAGTRCLTYLNGHPEDQVDIEPLMEGETHDQAEARIAARDMPNSTGEA